MRRTIDAALVTFMALAAASATRADPPSVKVRVVDHAGKPVKGARVLVWETGDKDGASEWTVADATSDGRGGVSLSGLDPATKYRLEVTPPSTREDLALFDEGVWTPAKWVVRLEPGFTVSGVVRDPLGRSLEDVSVYLFASVARSDGSRTTGGGSRVESNGTFRFKHVPRPRAVLRAFRQDKKFDDHHAVVFAVTPENPHVDVALAKDDESARVVRRVTGVPAGSPVYLLEPEWAQPAVMESLGWPAVPSMHLDATGHIRLQPTFESVLSALWIPPESPESDLSLYQEEVGLAPATAELRLAPGLSIRGRIAGEVPPGSSLGVAALGPGRIRVPGVVEADRTFIVRGLPKGRWTVVVDVVTDDGVEIGRGSTEAEAGGEATIAPQLLPKAPAAPSAKVAWMIITSPEDLRLRLEEAKRDDRPVVVSVWAEWCTYCKACDRLIEDDAELRAALAEFLLLRIDVTDDSHLEARGVLAMPLAQPLFVFVNSRGQVQRDLQIQGLPKRDVLLRRVTELGGR